MYSPPYLPFRLPCSRVIAQYSALSPYLGSGAKGVDAILQLSAHPSRFSLSIAVSPFLLLTATWPSLCNWPQIRQRFNKYLSRAIPYFSFSKLRRLNIASTFHSLSLLLPHPSLPLPSTPSAHSSKAASAEDLSHHTRDVISRTGTFFPKQLPQWLHLSFPHLILRLTIFIEGWCSFFQSS